MVLISAKAISKTFQRNQAVSDVSLDIMPGEVLALIGSNGAGKTTTINMLLGLLQPDEGDIQYWRDDYKNHIGVQLQTTPFFEGYHAEDNLKLFAALYGLHFERHEIEMILKQWGLYDCRHTPASKLSGGQQKKLAIAVTTLHKPSIVFLDEPAAGLDPRAQKEIRQVILKLAEGNTSVLFSSHDMDEVYRIADRVVMMHAGHIIVSGQPDELLKKYNKESLEALYLDFTESDR